MTMTARDVRRIGVVVLLAVAFGISDSVLKGNGDGIRAAIGNAAAPWLLLPFAGGALGTGPVTVRSHRWFGPLTCRPRRLLRRQHVRSSTRIAPLDR